MEAADAVVTSSHMAGRFGVVEGVGTGSDGRQLVHQRVDFGLDFGRYLVYLSRSIATALDVWQSSTAYGMVMGKFFLQVMMGHLCLVEVGWKCKRIRRVSCFLCNLARQQAWFLVPRY